MMELLSSRRQVEDTEGVPEAAIGRELVGGHMTVSTRAECSKCAGGVGLKCKSKRAQSKQVGAAVKCAAATRGARAEAATCALERSRQSQREVNTLNTG